MYQIQLFIRLKIALWLIRLTIISVCSVKLAQLDARIASKPLLETILSSLVPVASMAINGTQTSIATKFVLKENCLTI